MKLINQFFFKLSKKIKNLFINLIINAIQYDRMNFVSFLQKKSLIKIL